MLQCSRLSVDINHKTHKQGFSSKSTNLKFSLSTQYLFHHNTKNLWVAQEVADIYSCCRQWSWRQNQRRRQVKASKKVERRREKRKRTERTNEICKFYDIIYDTFIVIFSPLTVARDSWSMLLRLFRMFTRRTHISLLTLRHRRRVLAYMKCH